MPPRAFPLSLRVGTDICSIKRIRGILQISKNSSARRLDRFLPKLLTWPERQYFWNRFQSGPSTDDDIAAISQFLAGRWAAKEACRKACEHLGTSNGFHSIIILPVSPPDQRPDTETSRPQGLILRNKLPERPTDDPKTRIAQGPPIDATFDIESVEGQFCEVSISHDKSWATAVAIVPMLDWPCNTMDECESMRVEAQRAAPDDQSTRTGHNRSDS
ncbi:hypothetical protein CC80DRAFT_500826 [Byssothecium circinans]|uniref:4'-phosphopantetheinyl transferase domain-containing protein n=1 Tax=Byssothecium circinans TaxID=147558 RepID=A0A6A5U6N2_9PLEO|nr:hypothetical protein CC80DRAFT_500826 [Byssothecium circinans]